MQFHGYLLLLLLAPPVGCSLAAQQAEITVDSHPSSAEIRAWLRGDDPRMVAWGAYFASAEADQEATPELLKLAAGWTEPNSVQAPSEAIRSDEMAEVLDALIQNPTPVPPETLARISNSFPVQAMILASRLPIATVTPLLLSWYGDGQGKTTNHLDRVGAMLLSKAPPPGFAASIAAASQAQLSVVVVYNEGRGGGMGAASCGDGLGSGRRNGWPPLFIYHLEENRPASSFLYEPLLVEAGGDRIDWVREAALEGWGTCYVVWPLNDETRHALLAEMMGLTKRSMPWAVQESATIRWTNGDEFLRTMDEQVGDIETRLQDTVEALFVRGYLTVGEVQSVRTRLTVTVTDERWLPRANLPRWASANPHTVVVYSDDMASPDRR